MLEVLKEDGDRCPYNSRTKPCLICDNECRTDKKLHRLSRWSWRPRTWMDSVVFFLSILNVVFAHLTDRSIGAGREPAEGAGQYSPQWAVHIEGGQEVADGIAAKHGFVNLGKIFEDFYHFEHRRLQKRSLTPHTEYHNNLMNETQVKWAQQQVVKRRSKRDLLSPRTRSKSIMMRFNDEEWPHMWYLNRGQGLDMNVQEAWLRGISGKGVVVTILDDGLERTHPDLLANYDPQASYDVNNHDEDPMPRYDPLDSNRHGTRCAGEVAAVANNSLCSVGVAFGANVGGVRMLDGDVTDAVEARSLSLNPQHIDIYSASWGPDDDGKTVDGPGELATRAFIEGVTKGRQGKGSIFVWASGNGGREHDNCNCDGYTNSIWTLSISSATEHGLVPWYSEACSSTLATTYSSGSVLERQIVTTDLRHECTNGHTGTSASAPLAAGICALALEANRDLTWRDMQHIVVRTARPANLKSSDWKVNGVGRNVSHSFGYGLMDATAMVNLAKTWKTVPEQHRCEVSAPHVDKPIPARSKVILSLNVTECAGVNFLEHVQAKISLSSSRRGDLQIYLTSPAGTRSTLLARRPLDASRNPFNAWPFMSVHTWGEMPFGIWQLEIHNEGRYLGQYEGWQMLFYGTENTPYGDFFESGGRLPEKERKNLMGGKTTVEDGVPNHLDPETSNRGGWKDQATRRDDLMRTTTDTWGSSSSGCVSSVSIPTSQCIECVSGLYLYEGRCESVCPPRTYPGRNAKRKATCMPCHYTCLTCAGDSEGHCTSCHEEAVPVRSGLKDSEEFKTNHGLAESEINHETSSTEKFSAQVNSLTVDDDKDHLSWGKREILVGLVKKNVSVLSKRAVTKKILEANSGPRTLFYCYTSRVISQIKSSHSYNNMSILFGINLTILFGIIFYLLYERFCRANKTRPSFDRLKYRYVKSKSRPARTGSTVSKGELFISSSSEENIPSPVQ